MVFVSAKLTILYLSKANRLIKNNIGVIVNINEFMASISSLYDEHIEPSFVILR